MGGANSGGPKMKEITNSIAPFFFLGGAIEIFFLLVKWSRGHVLTEIRKNRNRGTPRKSGFFQERGRKRVKEWGDVTFMKEWVKALDDTRILAPADLR